MTFHPSLHTPETRQRDIDSRATVPHTFEMELEAAVSAYRGADLTVAYYGMKSPDAKAKEIAARSRDLFLAKLRPLLNQLVIQ